MRECRRQQTRALLPSVASTFTLSPPLLATTSLAGAGDLGEVATSLCAGVGDDYRPTPRRRTRLARWVWWSLVVTLWAVWPASPRAGRDRSVLTMATMALAARPRIAPDAHQPGEENFPPLQTMSTCSRYDDVRLHCDRPQRLVVHAAHFSSRLPLRELEQRCNHTDPGTYVKVVDGRHGYNCSEDIRSSLNQRCSGQEACLFSWTRDHANDPEARARCKGDGIITVEYRCVDFSSNALQITSVCSRRLGVEQSYGYLMSPGFPQYYVPPHRGKRCNWTIQGRLGQTVTVSVLDVRLRPKPAKRRGLLRDRRITATSTSKAASASVNNGASAGNVQHRSSALNAEKTGNDEHSSVADERATPSAYDLDEDCGDLLRLTSGNHGESLLADICVDRQRYFLNSFSSLNAVSVQFISSGFAPHRGFLLEYKVSGCPTLPAPKEGFLESRNSTAATYRCRRDFYFADNLSTHKTLYCFNGTRWTNSPLGECLSTFDLAYKGHLLLGAGYPGIRKKESAGGSRSSELPAAVLASNDIDKDLAGEDDQPLAVTALRTKESDAGDRFWRPSGTWRSIRHTMSEYADVIVPSVIIAVLLAGNAVIVLYIFRLRRQNKQRIICSQNPVGFAMEERQVTEETKTTAPLATI